MYKRLLGCVREYKLPTFLTLLFISLEALIECFIPATAADLINSVKNGAMMEDILHSGLILSVLRRHRRLHLRQGFLRLCQEFASRRVQPYPDLLF